MFDSPGAKHSRKAAKSAVERKRDIEARPSAALKEITATSRAVGVHPAPHSNADS